MAKIFGDEIQCSDLIPPSYTFNSLVRDSRGGRITISSGIAYKIDSICHTLLTTAYPKFLSELLTVYTPARPLRSSSDPNIPKISTTRTKSYGQRTFAYQGSSNWNRVW